MQGLKTSCSNAIMLCNIDWTKDGQNAIFIKAKSKESRQTV